MQLFNILQLEDHKLAKVRDAWKNFRPELCNNNLYSEIFMKNSEYAKDTIGLLL